MLGILLNSLTKASKVTEDLSTIYNLKQNIFGKGEFEEAYELNTSCTIQDVYNGSASVAASNTLEFTDFTVNEGVTLKPVHYTNGWGGYSGPFSPLIMKCTGTLTVNGSIISGGTGGMSQRFDGSATVFHNQCQTGIALDGQVGPGYSCSTNNFFKLATYGANGSFFDMKTAFYGAGGGGEHTYKRGHFHHWHHPIIHNYGFSCGGGAWSGDNHCWGCGGGFVALYFRELVINGKVYGKDPGCDVTKISACGHNGTNEAGFWGGGGSIIIAANKIIIGPNGTINSDALGGSASRLSYLNNPPQLSSGGYGTQYGYVMDGDGNLNYGAPTDAYYYSTGYIDENGKPEILVANGDASFRSGGAGVALGFQIK